VGLLFFITSIWGVLKLLLHRTLAGWIMWQQERLIKLIAKTQDAKHKTNTPILPAFRFEKILAMAVPTLQVHINLHIWIRH
jgi:hypothetical protein